MSPILQEPLDRLNNRKEKLYEQLQDVPTEQLQWKPSPQEWSIAQVLDHLNFSERSSLAYCRKKIMAGDALPERSFFRTLRIKSFYLILKSKFKIKAPAVVEAPANDLDLAALSDRAKQNTSNLREFAEEYPERFMQKAIFKHPLAGRITLPQMIRFLESHLEHHQHQINDRLSRLSSDF